MVATDTNEGGQRVGGALQMLVSESTGDMQLLICS